MYCLLEVVSVCPEKLAPRFVDKIDWIKVRTFIYSSVHIDMLQDSDNSTTVTYVVLWLKNETDISTTEHVTPISPPAFTFTCVSVLQSLMNTNKEDMRELAAQLYALVVSTMTGNELQVAVHNLVKITKDNHVRRRLSPTDLFYFFFFFTKY